MENMTGKDAGRPNDLQNRTFRFARDVRQFISALPRNLSTVADGSQVIRSSGSVGANYIEAQEALSRKDFAMRIKICRKEAKESSYWLELLSEQTPKAIATERERLEQEATALLRIFSAMVNKLNVSA